MNNILLISDLIGTFAFAITGCYTAIKHELDVLGFLILAFCTAIGGGIIRDILLGTHPPIIFATYDHIVVCTIAIIIVYFLKNNIASHWNFILLIDAIGLGVFTLFGCMTAYQHNVTNYFALIFFGVITAIGGGIIRDVLVCEISSVLKRGFYASASILGGIVFCILLKQNISFVIIFIAVFTTTFISRIIALKLNFELAKVTKLEKSPTHMTIDYNKW